VAEYFQAAAGAHGAVGQHHVQLAEREVGQQVFKFIFHAHQPHLRVHVLRGLQQAVGDQLGQRVGDADREAHLAGVGFFQRVLQLVAERENLVAIIEREAARFGRHQPSSLRLQQLLADRLLKRGELHADGLYCQPELLGGARDAAFLGHHPEEIQVAEINLSFFMVRFFEVMLQLSSIFQSAGFLYTAFHRLITTRENDEALQNFFPRQLYLPCSGRLVGL
jgi:hypothetical protein